MSGPRSLGDAISKACRDVFIRSDWTVGIVRRPIHAFLDPALRPEIEWIPSPGPGRFLADPFGLARDGRLHILCEDLDYGPRKGLISTVTVADGRPSPPAVVLETPWHMSYPYLIERDGDVYCVPETFEAREIALYKADPFPDRWRKMATLVADVAGLDATLFRHADRWWMFHTDQDRGPHDALFIRHAPDLLGPWTLHALAPAKVDPSSSRPAGTPFVHDTVLYRPAQDCSTGYGARVVINRVTRLTPDEFAEEPVAFVGPFPDSRYPDGVHTLSAVGDVTLLDAKADRFIPRAFRAALARGVRAALGLSPARDPRREPPRP